MVATTTATPPAPSSTTAAAASSAPSPSIPETTSSNKSIPLTAGEASNARLENTTACLPFVYGSVSFFLGKKADEYHTHKWTLYLRGANHEDLSGVIQKVVFQLHPSFTQPVRELTEPPFEVTERGWGEFEAQIRIIWKDPQEKATVVNHGIKLYPPGTTNMQPTKEPVISEKYDEVVFTDPKESFFQSLLRVSQLPKLVFPDEAVQACFLTYSDEDDFQKLLEAQLFLETELKKIKARMKLATDEMDQVDDALRELHESKKRAVASGSNKSKAGGGPSTMGASAAKKHKVG